MIDEGATELSSRDELAARAAGDGALYTAYRRDAITWTRSLAG